MTKKKPRNQWRRMGRPPLSAKKKRSRGITVRMTPDEHERLQAEARKQGLTVSELLMRPWRGRGKE